MQVSFLNVKRLNQALAEPLEAAFKRVMNSGWFVLGPELEAFEEEFARYCCVEHCVGVGNGLEALRLLLRAYGIGSGDEVIVPSNTFIATWLAVTHCGATPVAVEPNPATHNLDPALIEAALTPNTRAIIPVHLYGQTADMDPILAVANTRGLIVIEDAAQSQGARYKSRRAGSLGHAAATSFYPGKNLGGLGDGGAVLTNDRHIADKVRGLRNYGSTAKYQHDIVGYNSRLDELQAAFLRTKLAALDGWNEKRRSVAQHYLSALDALPLILPTVPNWAEPVWHLFAVRSSTRDALQAHLSALGIGTGIHYPIPPHLQACYAPWDKELPVAETLAREVISLPMSPMQTEEETEYVVEAVKKYLMQSGPHGRYLMTA